MLDKIKIQALLKATAETFGTPSISVGIYCDGEEFFFGEGNASPDAPSAPGKDTMYAIGSTTKAMTAAAIAILADEGKLDFEQPVKTYLPEFQMFDPYVTENLTVGDILCHRSGLPRHELMWYLNLKKYTLKDIVDRLKYLEPSQPFRMHFQYQNHMYMLAGLLIERVTGQKWDAFIRERITGPLGMDHTCFDSEGYHSYPDKAVPCKVDEDKKAEAIPFRDIYEIGSAGSVNSTASDMLKWIRLNLSGGNFKGQQIISEKNLKKCHTSQIICDDGSLNEIREIEINTYGFGWFIQSYKGVTVISHTGSIDGFIAGVAMIPSANAGFVILTNHGGGSGAAAIRYGLTDILLNLEPADWVLRIKGIADQAESNMAQEKQKIREAFGKGKNSLTHSLLDYAGEYEHPAYGVLKVTAAKDRLLLEIDGSTMELEHLGYNSFLFEHQEIGAAVTCKFDYNGQGEITKFLADFELKPICFTKKAL